MDKVKFSQGKLFPDEPFWITYSLHPNEFEARAAKVHTIDPVTIGVGRRGLAAARAALYDIYPVGSTPVPDIAASYQSSSNSRLV